MTKEEHNCDNVNCNHNDTKGLCCLFNPDNCKYRQLQKENAELKKKKEEIEIMTNFCEACKKMHTDNLTKAKEIIKGLLSFVDSLGNFSGGIFAKAEQFLKNDGCPDVMCEDCTKEDCGVKQLGLVEKVK